MHKSIINYIVLFSLLLGLAPAIAYADNSISGSFSIAGNQIVLAVGSPTYTSLTLNWTTPPVTPGWGPATQYDIRYSLSPITTEAEWLAATQLDNPPIPPVETVIVIGLNSCTTYYFAIKAADGSGTWTALSNSPDGKTLCSQGGGGGGGGGGFGLPASFYACPVTLLANMQGNITSVSMTRDGVLCEVCLAKDTTEQDTLELDKDTRVMLAGNVVPLLLKFTRSSAIPPTSEDTVIVGPVYEVNAYSSTLGTNPSPISISPAARLILNYDTNKLPENTTEVFIATYNTEEGWQPLVPVPGAVAEVGKAHGMVSHFSIFAVLAKVAGPEPARFQASNLTVKPDQVELNQEVTISLDVANTGGKSGDYSAELKVDGAVKSSTQVTIAPGDSEPVTFTITGDTAGKHQVQVAGLTGEFEVLIPAGQTTINWWLIGSIIGIIAVIVIWSIISWQWFKERKKVALATAASAEVTADKPRNKRNKHRSQI
jgi:CARDB